MASSRQRQRRRLLQRRRSAHDRSRRRSARGRCRGTRATTASSRSGASIVPVGLFGLAISSAFAPCSRAIAASVGRIDRPAVLRPACQKHRRQVQRQRDIEITGVAGSRQQDAIASVECGNERQQESGRRPRGDHDPLRRDRQAVVTPVVRGDAGTQLRQCRAPANSRACRDAWRPRPLPAPPPARACRAGRPPCG